MMSAIASAAVANLDPMPCTPLTILIQVHELLAALVPDRISGLLMNASIHQPINFCTKPEWTPVIG